MSEVVAEAPAAPQTPAVAPAAPAPAEPVKDQAQPPAESAPATPKDGEQKSTTDDPEKRSSRRFERRIDRLHKRAAEAQARAELLEKELQQYKQPKADSGAPKLEHFPDVEQYAEAKAKYESDRTLKEHESKQRTALQKQAHERLVQGWEEKATRGESRYEDFEEVVGEIQPTSALGVAIMRASNGEDIAYHLGKNLKEAQRIAALEPVDQFLEIGLLSAKLAAEPAKPKAPSKAPAPIAPLSGTSTVDSTVPSETDDMKTWFRKRQKQVHGR